MKKTFAIVGLTALSFSLTACSVPYVDEGLFQTSEKQETEKGEAEKGEEKTEITWSDCTFDDLYQYSLTITKINPPNGTVKVQPYEDGEKSEPYDLKIDYISEQNKWSAYDPSEGTEEIFGLSGLLLDSATILGMKEDAESDKEAGTSYTLQKSNKNHFKINVSGIQEADNMSTKIQNNIEIDEDLMVIYLESHTEMNQMKFYIDYTFTWNK